MNDLQIGLKAMPASWIEEHAWSIDKIVGARTWGPECPTGSRATIAYGIPNRWGLSGSAPRARLENESRPPNC